MSGLATTSAVETFPQRLRSILNRTNDYTHRGWSVIPVPYRRKKPTLIGWQRLRLTQQDLPRHFGNELQNIGVLLGEPSRWRLGGRRHEYGSFKQDLPNHETGRSTGGIDAAAPTESISMTNSNEKDVSEQAAPDPFDPATLRLSQDFASTVGVKKVLTKVPCRKPNRHEFVRVRPGVDWRVDTAVFEDNIDRETYLVQTDIIPDLAGEARPVCLRLAINKQGDIFLWPCKLPGPDGRSNHWHESAVEAATLAEKKWIRISANMGAGMYDVFQATGDLAEPTWPEKSFRDVLELSFRDRLIDSHDHPILKSLRGEV